MKKGDGTWANPRLVTRKMIMINILFSSLLFSFLRLSFFSSFIEDDDEENTETSTISLCVWSLFHSIRRHCIGLFAIFLHIFGEINETREFAFVRRQIKKRRKEQMNRCVCVQKSKSSSAAALMKEDISRRLSERPVIFVDGWDISRSLVIDTWWKNEHFYDSFESQINWRIRLMLAFRLTYASILISQINDNLFFFSFSLSPICRCLLNETTLVFPPSNNCSSLIFRRWLCDSERISLSKTMKTDVSEDFSTWIEYVIKKGNFSVSLSAFVRLVVHIDWNPCQKREKEKPNNVAEFDHYK